MPSTLLHCPVRGTLTVPEKASDQLTYTEEKRRIDCINFLLSKGYPVSHIKVETTLIRFGNKGRNSFRTDLAVLDIPAEEASSDISILRKHIKVIAEIKRDNADASAAKETQVYPALDFLQNLSAIGLYWDDVEQRLFYRTVKDDKTQTHEAPIVGLPKWGQVFHTSSIKTRDLRETNLLQLFKRIEDRLHSEVADRQHRFELLLQLLLCKIYDEYVHPLKGNEETDIQDFNDSPLSNKEIAAHFNKVLGLAISYYGRYLPNPVSKTIPLSGAMLRSISSLLAPVKILGSKRDVIQDFYMYFAKGVYKWDLGQYFTPSEVVDFIVNLVSPQAGEQIKDPACGSGDFLISAFTQASRKGTDLREAVWGADNSHDAVQVCVLNMVLNGDGKGNIKNEDSLENIDKERNSYSVMLCNPPFGVRIQERRFDVLQKFDLGHEWTLQGNEWQPTNKVSGNQEVGILFAELCLRQAAPGGRVGIILPNGYLGNTSPRYVIFRHWLLRQARLVAVTAFPRFTFKKSGADVSASAVILEKRHEPLKTARDSSNYPFYAGILESVGWSVSDKRAVRLYLRDSETGAYLTDESNNQIPDADFERVFLDLMNSTVPQTFKWLGKQQTLPTNDKEVKGWSVPISQVLARNDLSIDPKRWCERASIVRTQIGSVPHMRLGDIVDFIPEGKIRGGEEGGSHMYQYVEIQDTADGIIKPTPLRGWQLPDRAKHKAQTGDIFIGHIWGSVSKWFVAGGDCHSLVVSNGFLRLRIKQHASDCLVDLLSAINTEDYHIQARSLCTGSDGLAELSEDNASEILIPRVTNPEARRTLQALAEALLAGRATIASVVRGLQSDQLIHQAKVTTRSSHFVQV